MSRRYVHCWSLIAILGAVVLLPNTAPAPELETLFPPGGSRGGSVEVIAKGKFPRTPIHGWAHRPGITIAESTDTHSEERKLTLQVSSDAEPGVHWLRLYDDSGATVSKPFVVGALPEVTEQEPNDTLRGAQVLSWDTEPADSGTLNGRLGKGGDVDVFAVTVKRGQTLVADIDAQTPLASPVDAVLQVVSPDGFVYAQNDDQLGLDPRLAVVVPRDGLWYVRVFGFPAQPTKAIQLAGNPAYIYRLTISTGPYAAFAMPMAAERHTPTTFRLSGWNMATVLAEIIAAPPVEADALVLTHPALARPLHIPVVSHPVLTEAGPSSAETPMRVEIPLSITGRIEGPDDRDVYAFSAKQGDQVSVRIESRTLGFPLDPVLELTDGDGKRLSRVDDAGGTRDANLLHQVAADGELQLTVSDLHHHGGPHYVYRLSLERAESHFALSLDTHQIVVEAGAQTALPVKIERLHGHKEPIAVSVDGLPEGISVAAVTSKPDDDSSGKVTLEFVAREGAAPASAPVRVVGRVGKSAPEAARISGSTAPLIDLWLTVTSKDE